MKICAPKFRAIALALLLASIPCGAVGANPDYYRHVIFDNSLTSDAYYYSHGMANGSSFLELKGARISHLWETVEWDWYRGPEPGDFLYWHWSARWQWHIQHPLIGFNEVMITYLLAMASPTHSIPPEMYSSGWASQSERAVKYRAGWSGAADGDHYANGHTYYGIKLDVGVGTGGPLFFTH